MVQWRQLSKQLHTYDEAIARFEDELAEYQSEQNQGNQSLENLAVENDSLAKESSTQRGIGQQ